MAITKIQSESLNLADNYDFTGTVTGAGEANTPAWNAYRTTGQTSVGDAFTKIIFNAEALDTDNAFDTSNGRFTVPAGKGGDYYVYLSFLNNYDQDRRLTLRLYKNGSGTHRFYDLRTYFKAHHVATIINLSAGDYIEWYYIIEENPVNGAVDGSGENETKFGGFRIKS
jgi:hypothetical protein